MDVASRQRQELETHSYVLANYSLALFYAGILLPKPMHWHLIRNNRACAT